MTDAAPIFDEIADAPAGGRGYWLRTDDDVRIRVGVWSEGEKGTVLLFPGRTEFVEKYGPAAASLARRGFATLVIDWRGQGLSDRLLPTPMTGHVGRFSDYQHDLRAAMQATAALGLPQPFFLLAHSMGGAIGLRSLIEDLAVQAAVFTAPMWGIRITPAMRPLAWAIATGARAAGLGRTIAPGTEPLSYVLTAPFEGNVLTTDPAIYQWMKQQMHAHPELALGGPSLHWLHEALVECRHLRSRTAPPVPSLVMLGANERVVDTATIHDRLKRWPSAKLDLFPGAEHEVLMETPERRARAYDRMAAFFDAHRLAPVPEK